MRSYSRTMTFLWIGAALYAGLLLADPPIEEGPISIDLKYGAELHKQHTCDGPTAPCQAGASVDCAPAWDCVTAGDVVTCQIYIIYYGFYYCRHLGYECSGTCEGDQGLCYNSQTAHCSSDYWWYE